MIQTPVLFTARDGREFEIRSPREDEAQDILNMMTACAADSPYILSVPETFRKIKIEDEIKWIQSNSAHEAAIIIAVYHEGRMVGLCSGSSYKDIKRKHRAVLGVSLLPEVRGCGLGYKLMEILIASMKQFSGIKIIELDVMLNNKVALQMYEKLGFKRAGVFPKAFILPSGEVSDNLTMYIEV